MCISSARVRKMIISSSTIRCTLWYLRHCVPVPSTHAHLLSAIYLVLVPYVGHTLRFILLLKVNFITYDCWTPVNWNCLLDLTQAISQSDIMFCCFLNDHVSSLYSSFFFWVTWWKLYYALGFNIHQILQRIYLSVIHWLNLWIWSKLDRILNIHIHFRYIGRFRRKIQDDRGEL